MKTYFRCYAYCGNFGTCEYRVSCFFAFVSGNRVRAQIQENSMETAKDLVVETSL